MLKLVPLSFIHQRQRAEMDIKAVSFSVVWCTKTYKCI